MELTGKTDFAAEAPFGATHAQMMHPWASGGAWRVLDVVATGDVPFELVLKNSLVPSNNEPLFITGSRSILVCLWTASLQVLARSLHPSRAAALAGRVSTTLNPIPTQNHAVFYGMTSGGADVVAIPDYARAVRLDVPRARSPACELELHGPLGVVGTLSSNDPAAPVAGLTHVRLTSATVHPYRVTFELHI